MRPTRLLTLSAFLIVLFSFVLTTQTAGAQTSTQMTPATTLSPTRVILLGTGAGPIPRKDRSQPANLLVVEGHPYLIDAGNGVARQMVYAGYMPSDVRTVFITHHHIDHNADIGALMSFAWIEDTKRNNPKAGVMRFYGPSSTADLVQAGLSFLSVSERIFRSGVPMPPAAGRFEAHEFKGNGVVYRDDRLVVTAAENAHYHLAQHAGHAETKDKSYALRFDAADRSIVFCGDTGPSEAVTQLAKGADVLVCSVNELEASMQELAATTKLPPPAQAAVRAHMERQHITPEQIGMMAQKAGVKTVVLTHFAPGRDGETDASLYTRGVRKHFSGTVIAGRDLMEF